MRPEPLPDAGTARSGSRACAGDYAARQPPLRPAGTTGPARTLSPVLNVAKREPSAILFAGQIAAVLMIQRAVNTALNRDFENAIMQAVID